jgi:lactoylglutathione lyase
MTSTHPSDTAAAAAAPGLNAFKPRLTHVSYHVADIDRALHFYIQVLGMKELMRLQIGKTLHEVVLGFADPKVGGVILMWNTERKTPIEQAHGFSRFIFNVADLDGALAHLAKHEANIVAPAKDAGAFKYAMVKDPDGYVIELLQNKR